MGVCHESAGFAAELDSWQRHLLPNGILFFSFNLLPYNNKIVSASTLWPNVDR